MVPPKDQKVNVRTLRAPRVCMWGVARLKSVQNTEIQASQHGLKVLVVRGPVRWRLQEVLAYMGCRPRTRGVKISSYDHETTFRDSLNDACELI